MPEGSGGERQGLFTKGESTGAFSAAELLSGVSLLVYFIADALQQEHWGVAVEMFLTAADVHR